MGLTDFVHPGCTTKPESWSNLVLSVGTEKRRSPGKKDDKGTNLNSSWTETSVSEPTDGVETYLPPSPGSDLEGLG